MNKVREWKNFLIPYDQAVEELKVKFKSIRREFVNVNDYSPIEFVTGRVKKISSILEKAKRRNIAEKNIAEEMEDIAGIRIMCQFIDDIYIVVKLIHARRDMEIVYEKDYITNPKDSGYKSFHIIIKYPVQTIYGEKEILAEIQIRTLAMNFWATIEHSLNYKYPLEIPKGISDKLKKAATAASLLDKEMYSIRHEVIQAQLLFEQKSNIVSDITNNIQNLVKNGTSKKADEFQKEFEKIWENSNVDDLNELSTRIKEYLPRYKIFSDQQDEKDEK